MSLSTIRSSFSGGRLSRRLLNNNGIQKEARNTRVTRTMSTDSSPQSNRVKIVEVGPRDGLQNEALPISVQEKVTFIQKLFQAGCSFIEAGAFVSPKRVPQMANSDKVFQNLSFEGPDKPQLSCLVPNRQGMEKALATPNVNEIAIFASASESFSQRNIACSIEESLHRFEPVIEMAKTHNLPVRGYVSTIVGCPYQGSIEPSQVAHVVERMLDLGCYEISLGDTIGVGTPGSIRAMLKEVMVVAKPSELALHCHDTYGQALANILVGLENEIPTMDSSVAGLGGCPFAKGASGNVATEDVVYMLNGMGISTGIDLDSLIHAGDYICQALNNRQNQSKVATAMKMNKLAVNDK